MFFHDRKSIVKEGIGGRKSGRNLGIGRKIVSSRFITVFISRRKVECIDLISISADFQIFILITEIQFM